MQDYEGDLWTCVPVSEGSASPFQRSCAERYNLNIVMLEHKASLSAEPGHVHGGSNSGYQAVNLAFNMGASEVILLGYDMQASVKTHWFGDHPGAMNVSSHYNTFIRAYETIGEEWPITNCSRDTALTCFPRMGLEEYLAQV